MHFTPSTQLRCSQMFLQPLRVVRCERRRGRRLGVVETQIISGAVINRVDSFAQIEWHIGVGFAQWHGHNGDGLAEMQWPSYETTLCAIARATQKDEVGRRRQARDVQSASPTTQQINFHQVRL